MSVVQARLVFKFRSRVDPCAGRGCLAHTNTMNNWLAGLIRTHQVFIRRLLSLERAFTARLGLCAFCERFQDTGLEYS